MFDQFKNLQGLAGILKNADQFRDQFKQLNDELADHRINAETGGGAVRVTVSGALRIINIEVDPTMLGSLVDLENADDRDLAQQLIAGAVNAALEKAKQHVSEEMARRAQEMGLPIPPGTDLTQLLG